MPVVNAKPQAQDALELEIFRETIRAVIDELEVNLTRTSYSFLIHEYKDFCIGFLTRDCCLASQSQGNIPIFITDLAPAVKDIVDLIGEDDLEPGDVFVTNFNPVSGQHLNNVVAATPIFSGDGSLAGYLAIKSHWADVGGINIGGAISLNARHIIQEGVQYRGVRIMRRGEIAPEVLATIQANTYQTSMVTGDLMAQLSACILGAQRWDERVASRWTQSELEDLFAAQFAASTRFAEEGIDALPDGEYAAACELDEDDDDGKPIRLRVKVIISGKRLTVDLSGMPPQVQLPVNAGRQGGAISASRVAFKAIIAPEWPADDALFEPLDVVVPDGTIVSAVNGAPMSNWNMTMATLIDLVVRAIGESMPERTPAGHFGTMSIMSISGVNTDGSFWLCPTSGGGGFGGHSDGDGYGPVSNYMLGDNMMFPCEVIEARFPLRVRSFTMRRDAGGDGRFRGGPGMERVVEVLAPAKVGVVFDRTRDPAWGLAGGGPGSPGGVLVKHLGSTEWVAVEKDTVLVEAGAMLAYRTGGGGGWGTTSGEPRSDE
jgi:N-methylhydantoinase B